jgi:glycosyltransferase involved in cell wall biosynthesis
LISIITVTLNSSKTLRATLDSLASQKYTDFELIIVDGVSTDNTLEILTEFELNYNVLSEPDNGIYDAMNKGIKLAKGDIIGILNSDDFYATNDTLERIVKVFEETNCECLFGNLDFVSADNIDKVVRHWKSSPFVLGSFSKGWHPPHPTFFVLKEIYQKFGLFDTDLNISADFELMLRFLEVHKISNYYLDKTIVKMRYGGESTKSLKNIIKGNKNIIKAFEKNGVQVSPFYPFFRVLPKLKQFIIK